MIEIAKWNETFESADTRKRQRLKSFHCPSGVESRGLLNLLCHFDGQAALAAFGVFQLVCQLSATLPAEHRGRLIHSDSTPMTVDFLSRLLRIEICHLSAALEILSDKRVAWILLNQSADDLPLTCQSHPAFVQGEGEGEGEEVSKLATPASPPDPTPRKHETPNADAVTAYARSAPVPISPECGQAFFDQQEAGGWLLNNGHPIADWRALLRRYASRWNENEKSRASPGIGNSAAKSLEKLEWEK